MKKYISIFLIFFLLLCLPLLAFAAETSDIVPPELDTTLFDSYLISTRSYTNGTSDFYCYLYHSSDWYPYVPEGREYVQILSFNENPKPLYSASVPSSSYDSSLANNGWGSFRQITGTEWEFNDGSIYHSATVQGSLILSNRDIPYANLDKDSKTLNYTGQFFFTLTPPLVVETGKALNQFQTLTIHNLMIIALCGVGCLAFLISLPILRKVLLRFLNR